MFLCLDKSVFSDYKLVNIEFEEFKFCTNPNDLAAIYRKADIFLCTSVQDAAPMMLAEALMCGLPTISFDTATAKQFIEDNIDGYVIDQYDTVGFAKKVIDLIDQIGSGKFTFQNKRRLHEKMINLYGIDAVKKQMGVILNTPNDN
jgi:glycosyltransferase involved in cell wall biosynthesis